MLRPFNFDTLATRTYDLASDERLVEAAERVVVHNRAAAKLVRPNDTIILDSGTTTLEVARHLKTMNLRGVTVITNANRLKLWRPKEVA